MSNHADLILLSIHRRHAFLAVACAIFSILLHVVFMSWMSSTQFGISFMESLRMRDPMRPAPMHVREVHPESASAPRAASAPATDQPVFHPAAAVDRLQAPADTVDVEPPPAPGPLGSDTPLMPEAPPLAAPDAWQPRQDIVMVERTTVRDELAAMERRVVARIERMPVAADVVYPAVPASIEAPPLAGPPGAGGIEAPNLADILGRVTGSTSGSGGGSLSAASLPEAPVDAVASSGAGVLAESPAAAAPARPLEDLLTAGIATYTSRQDPEFGYFKIEIRRRNEQVLPVIPKDVLFIQDCSASMSEERLHFCRDGLTASLPLLGPDDRFNLVSFRHVVDSCFSGWSANTPDARARAERYIAAMRSEGETDLFQAIREALSFAQQPGRPVIVLLISDGVATTGLTDGAAIVREFTKANRGAVSVFTMGTLKQARLYLLDLLSYSNRGDSRVVTQGRWAIPDVLQELVVEVSQPVLSEVRTQVAAATPCEVYPVQTKNLYQDGPLVLRGRYRLGQPNVVIQATGRAGDTVCDMIFDLSLEAPTLKADEDLREQWGRQKLWHLLGLHARTRDSSLLPQIDETSRLYRVAAPHRNEL
jgi:hypothetical protein